jgi:hypothetical protein
MAHSSLLPPPGGPARYGGQAAQSGAPGGRALVAGLLVAAGTAVLGLAGGLIWAGIAPRVVYQVYTLKPPIAYAVNPETNAFIAADGIYCFIALAGGVLAALLCYRFIRRYGPLPMAGLVVGSVVAAFLAMWTGHLATGAGTFDHLLATSKPGALLRAPISLGAHGALAFWPLAAGLVAGGIELAGFLRARAQARDDRLQLPGGYGRAVDPPEPDGLGGQPTP